ncbi:hypothetical protein [Arthrobacter sp. H14-L1]|uniref:Rv1678 family membrane protein n=1 Tax=Arthrobacter sp. H14-L1 TaxID=2996697 RepID=UPI00226E7DEE|nr:hypothetical protein [Arthrobacter sp. H14-L1]MCY0905945.1 hypothetical protein [Arthrobacter sp. H14-L1]
MSSASGTADTRSARTPRDWRIRGLIVAGFTALSSLFALVNYTPLQFVSVNLVQALAFVVLGALAALGCVLRIPVLLFLAGTILIVIGLVRLVTYGQTIGIISGSVNAAALMVGFGAAFLAIWLTSRPA